MLGVGPGERALVLAPHPDDEVLGAGGTIATLTAAGVHVEVLVVACASMRLHGGTSDPHRRARELTEAAGVLGVAGARIAWPGQTATDRPAAELVALVEQALAAVVPDLLLLPTEGSHHHEHQAVHAAGLAALRPGAREDRPLPRLVLGFDGPEDRLHRAAGLARPVQVDVTAAHPVKLKALGCYSDQLRPPPHPRSLDTICALDAVTGAARGVGFAEAFALYRAAA